MAAVIDYDITDATARGLADTAVVLDMPKEEEAALLAMLPQHVPPLKRYENMRTEDESMRGVYDPETGRSAAVLSVTVVSIGPAPIPRPGLEATAVQSVSGPGSVAIYEYTLRKASGRWVVVSRQRTAVS